MNIITEITSTGSFEHVLAGFEMSLSHGKHESDVNACGICSNLTELATAISNNDITTVRRLYLQ